MCLLYIFELESRAKILGGQLNFDPAIDHTRLIFSVAVLCKAVILLLLCIVCCLFVCLCLCVCVRRDRVAPLLCGVVLTILSRFVIILLRLFYLNYVLVVVCLSMFCV